MPPLLVSVGQAKTQLSRLIARVEAGEEVKVAITDEFFDPLPEEELKLWEGG